MRRFVLVTRPEPGLGETMAALCNSGWQAVASPVMTMHHTSPMVDHSCRAMLITSSQALPFLACQDRNRLLLTVGQRTAERARAKGFCNVKAAGGNQAALEAFCQREGLAGSDLILACGRGRHGQAYGVDLARALGAAWFEAYQVHPRPGLADEAIAALTAGQVRAVLFYSSETARLFMELCPDILYGQLAHCQAICLSPAIAETLRDYGLWGRITAGRHPVSLLGGPARQTGERHAE